MKPVEYKFEDVQNALVNEIARLNMLLANEVAGKLAVVKYAEELESEVGELRKNAK